MEKRLENTAEALKMAHGLRLTIRMAQEKKPTILKGHQMGNKSPMSFQDQWITTRGLNI